MQCLLFVQTISSTLIPVWAVPTANQGGSCLKYLSKCMTLKIIYVQDVVLCTQYRVNNFWIGYSPLVPCGSPLYGSLQTFTGLVYIYPDKYQLLLTSGCTAYVCSWLQNILVRGCLCLEIFCILNRIGTRELSTVLTKSSRIQQDQMETNKQSSEGHRVPSYAACFRCHYLFRLAEAILASES